MKYLIEAFKIGKPIIPILIKYWFRRVKAILKDSIFQNPMFKLNLFA